MGTTKWMIARTTGANPEYNWRAGDRVELPADLVDQLVAGNCGTECEPPGGGGVVNVIKAMGHKRKRKGNGKSGQEPGRRARTLKQNTADKDADKRDKRRRKSAARVEDDVPPGMPPEPPPEL